MSSTRQLWYHERSRSVKWFSSALFSIQRIISQNVFNTTADAERQAWRRLVGKNDGSSGGFCPIGAAVARAWYRWCAGQGKQVFDSASIANRDKYHPPFGELLHYLLSWYAFDGLVRSTPSQRRPLRRSIDLKSICSRAQRSGAHVVY